MPQVASSGWVWAMYTGILTPASVKNLRAACDAGAAVSSRHSQTHPT
jgi:hypothetical protein